MFIVNLIPFLGNFVINTYTVKRDCLNTYTVKRTTLHHCRNLCKLGAKKVSGTKMHKCLVGYYFKLGNFSSD